MTKQELAEYRRDLKREKQNDEMNAVQYQAQQTALATQRAALKVEFGAGAQRFENRVNDVYESFCEGIDDSLLPEKLGRFGVQAHEQAANEMPAEYAAWLKLQ